jgi:hypothetical protein
MNGMTGSLDITQLLDWLEGRLTEDEAKTISDAVQADESVQAKVTWLQNFLNLSRSTVLIEPPADLLRDATTHFRALAEGTRPANWLQRFVATLTSDSWQRLSLVSVRRTGFDVMPRQLVYQTDAADLVLNIRAGGDESVFDLFGQVFPKGESDPASFTVQLTQRGQEVESALTYTDVVGKFTCPGLAADSYTIIIRGDQVEITVADVDLST